ncbi:hypothetical protein ACFYTQ_18515 [Nocardia sp. NPDC004068]|uniref:hypothetical protein n=1 Tax=Nocardia sp. NPDC004068 TaxID=3364303 RepID=UPI0036C6B7E2
MMPEWNDNLEQQYRRYGGNKWMQGLPARSRENWLKARSQWIRAREVGNRFRDGMAALNGQTPQNGYKKEVRLQTSLGVRVADIANPDSARTIEYKSGGMEKSTALAQLAKDEELIQFGWSSTWTIVEGARIDKEVQERIRELQTRYPGQFVVREVTREQLRIALTVAKNLEKKQKAKEKEARQLEKAQENRRRQAEKAKELAKQKEALTRTVQQTTQQLAVAQEQSLSVDAATVAEAHQSAKDQLRSVRKAERGQTKDMLREIGVQGEHARAMEQILAQGRENQRQEIVQGIEAIGHAAAREAQAQAAREAALAWQRQQMELAKQRGYAPELQAIMELMNQGRPAPGVALPGAPAEAPEVTRDGRAKQHALELAKQQGLDPRGLR